MSKSALSFYPYLSRDLSWLQFNRRVLALAEDHARSPFNRLRFLSISASNQDEFFMIRLGGLYNFIDYNKKKDSKKLKLELLRKELFEQAHQFHHHQHQLYTETLFPALQKANCFIIKSLSELDQEAQKEVEEYFNNVLFPLLTPMSFEEDHQVPLLRNRTSAFCVVTQSLTEKTTSNITYSFIQLPTNLPRFYEVSTENGYFFIPLEEIIRSYLPNFFQNVKLLEAVFLRVTRNGDFSLEESEGSDDMEEKLLEELKRQLKKRNTSEVIRLEIEEPCSSKTLEVLKSKWEITDQNVFWVKATSLIDFIALHQVAYHPGFSDQLPKEEPSIPPLTMPGAPSGHLFDELKKQDVLIHRPYNSFPIVLNLLEEAAEDPKVLAIKLTVYRLAEDSAIVKSLIKAAKNGKQVAVLIELKARFDEEHNMQEAKRLQKAGCSVIYGRVGMKTHAKLLFIVRDENKQAQCYVHMSSGNYNEKTAQYYTDVSLLTTDPGYAKDVSNFFNVITGHSYPQHYENLITAPIDLREKLLAFIDREISYANKGMPAGIVLKLNALSDKTIIDALYKASQAGVQIKLIVRGICCLIPDKKGLSENIEVKSIVGEYLEHARLFYFHNNGDPVVYGGSADIMVRSFDKRIESLFLIKNKMHQQQIIHLLWANLEDNVNSYLMKEDGSYERVKTGKRPPFNVHKAFYQVKQEDVMKATLLS